ncbi:YeeE/YedE thiosulfate transporter family protein [Aeromicrobium sp.]|uniref:YeeE/YedE thiosulfate transporter family protein n=1 Tax=Aeromicrobium sp. TaxID=1871063 RepID=UPI003D6B8976
MTGAVAGLVMGYVLQRGQLCFHSTIAGSLARRFTLARGWALGVALGSVGLAILFTLPGTEELNRGLAFRPVANVIGGLIFGVGMVVAQSCISGLFFRLGAGMLGALVGLTGWGMGELVAREITVPGPTLLSGGDGATLPGLFGLPRLLVAAAALAIVAIGLWRTAPRDRTSRGRGWGWAYAGIGLGVAITAGWTLAALGDSTFGPSSVGAVNSIATGSPNYWLIAFLLGIVGGAVIAARTAGGFRVRGERPVRYVQLAGGGFLLGVGGWIAGGCNLGHGLSGMAQLNVSSLVVVVAMVVGVAVARRMRSRIAVG